MRLHQPADTGCWIAYPLCTIGADRPGHRGQILPSRSATPNLWGSTEKICVVLGTAQKVEAGSSPYRREHKLYLEQTGTSGGAARSPMIPVL